MPESLIPSLARTTEQRELQETLSRFLDDVLPLTTATHLDNNGEFPTEIWKGLAELGVLGLAVDPEVGGSGGGATEAAIAVVEIAKRYPSLAISYILCGMTARLLAAHGSDEQRGWLAAMCRGEELTAFALTEPDGGTDVLGLRTRATLDNGQWTVDGQKMWTTQGYRSDRILVMSRTDPVEDGHRARGVSLVAVDPNQAGVLIRPLPTMSMRGGGTSIIHFDGATAPESALVGPRGRGFHILRDTLDVERILAASVSIGIAASALEQGVAYAAERHAFGRAIGEYQAVQHPLVDSWAELAAAIALTDQSLQQIDAGHSAAVSASMAKLVAGETTARIVDRVMRVYGGIGIAIESHVQMLFRDARLQTFSPISNEMVRNNLSVAMGLPRSY